jgi:hypothetical protein
MNADIRRELRSPDRPPPEADKFRSVPTSICGQEEDIEWTSEVR